MQRIGMASGLFFMLLVEAYCILSPENVRNALILNYESFKWNGDKVPPMPGTIAIRVVGILVGILLVIISALVLLLLLISLFDTDIAH